MLANYFIENPNKWHDKYAKYIKEYSKQELREMIFIGSGMFELSPADTDSYASLLYNIKDVSTLKHFDSCFAFTVLLLYKLFQHDDSELIINYSKYANGITTPFIFHFPLPYFEDNDLRYSAGDTCAEARSREHIPILYLMLLFKSSECAEKISKSKLFTNKNFNYRYRLPGILPEYKNDYFFDYSFKHQEMLLFIKAFLKACRSVDGIRTILECSKFVSWNEQGFFDTCLKIVTEAVSNIAQSSNGLIRHKNRFYNILSHKPPLADHFKSNGMTGEDNESFEHYFDWMEELQKEGDEKIINISNWFSNVDEYIATMLKAHGLIFLGWIRANEDGEVENNIQQLMNAMPKAKPRRDI